jgi:hypothetical protein
MKFTRGDMVVPVGGKYPEEALVVDGYDEAERLLAHPLGGGFERTISAAQAELLRIVDEAERAQICFQPSTFRLPESENLFDGWTDGQLCEGWAMPRFEADVCHEILQVKGGDSAWYDYRTDAFVVVRGDEELSCPAEEITTVDGAQLTVYTLGAGAWMWERVALN